MNIDYQKQLKSAFFIVFMFFLCFFIFSFFYYRFYVKKEISRKDALVVKYNSSNNVKIENKLPISDALGKTYSGDEVEDGIQEYVTFSIENRTNINRKYYILINKQRTEKNVFLEKYIKVYLTNEKDEPYDGFLSNPLPLLSIFPAYSKVPSSRVLYSGIIKKKDTLYFKLRMWLSDTYIITNEKEFFSAKILVE